MQTQLLSEKIPNTQQELLQVILSNRSIDQVEEFLHPKNPAEISCEEVEISTTEIQTALSLLERAKDKKQTIVIYGDYDCDGVCATAVLWETLFSLGFKVAPFIPHREKHGYGLSQKGVDEVLSQCTPDIVISVDNGIVAHEQWQRLHELGITCILTDHHQPDEKTPLVDSIIHTTSLCGTTVAWCLAREAEKHFNHSTDHTSTMLDLCAIATIADQVPLTQANRSFAKYGLEQLNQTSRIGLLKLIETAGLQLGEIDAYAVNFGIAPRINAMGRLEHALDALRALCTTKPERVAELISKLSDVNQTRQDMTQTLIEKAILRAKEWDDEHIIIVEDEEFHEGIIGLIASKLTEKYFKPTICISVGEITSKASCRSISGVHITNMLRKVLDDLLEVGGHPMAAGFKIETGKIDIVRHRLRLIAKEEIQDHMLIPRIEVDCVLLPSLLSTQTAHMIEELAPFGSGNREPLFLLEKMQVLQTYTVGKEGKHLKLSVLPENGKPNEVVHAIAFGNGWRKEGIEQQKFCSLVAHVSINRWKGRESLQLMVKEIFS